MVHGFDLARHDQNVLPIFFPQKVCAIRAPRGCLDPKGAPLPQNSFASYRLSAAIVGFDCCSDRRYEYDFPSPSWTVVGQYLRSES